MRFDTGGVFRHMPTLEFHQLDVFTDQAFGGNPLAVFPNADGLDTARMQAIAREMNLSETTFVMPPEAPDADFKVRIFTPGAEMPFAGHPVIGTHWALAMLGRINLQAPVTTVKLELGVGVRAAKLYVENGKVVRVVMDHQPPEFCTIATSEQTSQLEEALGLAPGSVAEHEAPVQVVSTGVRQLFVPVRSLEEVQSLDPSRLNTRVITQLLHTLDPETHCHDCLMVLTTETVNEWAQVHTRLFAPEMGISEDPATGSASGGLGAYLVKYGLIPATPPTTIFTAEQGIEMGRPSRIDVEVEGQPGAVSMVRVGGEAIPLIEGTLRW